MDYTKNHLKITEFLPINAKPGDVVMTHFVHASGLMFQ